MAYIGTLTWVGQTGGRIGFRDRAELSRLAAVTGFIDLPRYLLYRGPRRSWSPAGSYDDVPDTEAATAALTRLRAVAPAYLINHSVRTYWLSRLIGEATGLMFDDELLYVASLAHDVGLCVGRSSPSSSEQCFSIRGANWASDIAMNAGWKTQRTDRLAEAITLNLNGRVPPTLGVEAHLMMRGVLVDVTGLYAWCVERSQIQGLFRQFPRLNQRTKLPVVFRSEADRQPECRAHFAMRLARLWSSYETSTQRMDIARSIQLVGSPQPNVPIQVTEARWDDTAALGPWPRVKSSASPTAGALRSLAAQSISTTPRNSTVREDSTSERARTAARRVRRHRPEQRPLIGESGDVGDALRTVGDRDRQINQHPPGIVRSSAGSSARARRSAHRSACSGRPDRPAAASRHARRHPVRGHHQPRTSGSLHPESAFLPNGPGPSTSPESPTVRHFSSLRAGPHVKITKSRGKLPHRIDHVERGLSCPASGGFTRVQTQVVPGQAPITSDHRLGRSPYPTVE